MGYGGDGWAGGDGGKRARDQQAAAAQRQVQLDATAARLLSRLRQRLEDCTGAAVVAGVLAPLEFGHTASSTLLHRAVLTCRPSHNPSNPSMCAAAAAQQLAPLPLPLLGVLRGGPAAPLLRLLLQSDSLMDVSARRQLYTAVFGLVNALAGDLFHLFFQGGVTGRHQPRCPPHV